LRAHGRCCSGIAAFFVVSIQPGSSHQPAVVAAANNAVYGQIRAFADPAAKPRRSTG
jgi:hypothetical protein